MIPMGWDVASIGCDCVTRLGLEVDGEYMVHAFPDRWFPHLWRNATTVRLLLSQLITRTHRQRTTCPDRLPWSVSRPRSVGSGCYPCRCARRVDLERLPWDVESNGWSMISESTGGSSVTCTGRIALPIHSSQPPHKSVAPMVFPDTCAQSSAMASYT
jgi:hypothetical protein